MLARQGHGDESAFFFDRDQARFVTGIYTAAIPSDGVNSVLSIELGQMVAGVSYVCICVCVCVLMAVLMLKQWGEVMRMMTMRWMLLMHLFLYTKLRGGGEQV